MTLNLATLDIGQTFTEVVIENLTRTQIVMYAGASGDFNPLHTDEVFARDAVGYPTVFAHGMFTMGVTARMLVDLAGTGRLRYLNGRFLSQVWPGDTLTVTATVDELSAQASDTEPSATLSVETTNARGEAVLKGRAIVMIDA